MALIVNTNAEALSAQRNLSVNNNKLSKSIKRLSSGLRINSAADDAAGLSIATKFQAQVRGINQAIRNSNNAISLVQVAEGGINTITNILQRLRELAVQAASDDNTKSDRATLTKEADNLVEEFNRVANTSEFNTQTLLDGSFKNQVLQIGPNNGQTLTLNIGDIRGTAIGGRAEFNASIGNGVTTAIDENFGAGEIKINGVDVANTNAADDQFSVLDISGAVAGLSAGLSGSATFNINGTSVTVVLSAGVGGASAVTILRDAINAAGITNVTARVFAGSAIVIEAKGGANLNLAVNGDFGKASALSAFGLNAGSVSALFGAGSAADAVNNSNGESGAIAKAVAINQVKSTTSVSATAVANVVTAAGPVNGTNDIKSGEVFINGVDIGKVTVEDNDSTGALVTAINNKTTDTGVTASVSGSGNLVLTAADGRNITITTETAGLGTTTLGLTGSLTNNTALFRGNVRLNSNDTFDLSSSSSLEDLDSVSNKTSISIAKDVSKFNIKGLKIDTQQNAQSAILTIDAALNDVNDLRSDLGAVQNRLEFTIANLEIAGENTSASESRIRDADFASEVAIFTKNQILVQAGTAMLAQANTLPQIALQLLQ